MSPARSAQLLENELKFDEIKNWLKKACLTQSQNIIIRLLQKWARKAHTIAVAEQFAIWCSYMQNFFHKKWRANCCVVFRLFVRFARARFWGDNEMQQEKTWQL